MTGPVFPVSARPADKPHPSSCPCIPCIDALLAEVSQPVVVPAPRTDPATHPCDRPPAGWTCSRPSGHYGPCATRPAGDRKQSAYGDWLTNRPAPRLEYVDDVTRHDIWPDGYRPDLPEHRQPCPCVWCNTYAPDANRATRGPGTGGGAGRRPSGPGRRRSGGSLGGEGAPGGCASAATALFALAVIALAAAAGLIWLAAH